MTNRTDPKRNEKVRKLRSEGYTYQEIGDEIGVSRERVRQILNRYGHPDNMKVHRKFNGVRLPEINDAHDMAVAWLEKVGPKTLDETSAHFKWPSGFVSEALGDESWMLASVARVYPQKWSDKQVKAAIARTAKKFGEPVTMAKYDMARNLGFVEGPSCCRIIQRYGTWRNAVLGAGFTVSKPKRTYESKWTDDEIWGYVLRFITESTPSIIHWDKWRAKHAPEAPSSTMIRNRLGQWSDIYNEAARRIIEENKVNA